MNENLDLTKILKDCPEGTKLYSPVFGDVEFVRVYQKDSVDFIIEFKLSDNSLNSVTTDGRLCEYYDGECVLFPSKDQRDWSKFNVKKHRFDPKTFQPFDKVLVKRGDENYHLWFPDFISFPPNDVDETVLCMTTDDVDMVIPYNEETKRLIETNEDAPEFYRYWED